MNLTYHFQVINQLRSVSEADRSDSEDVEAEFSGSLAAPRTTLNQKFLHFFRFLICNRYIEKIN